MYPVGPVGIASISFLKLFSPYMEYLATILIVDMLRWIFWLFWALLQSIVLKYEAPEWQEFEFLLCREREHCLNILCSTHTLRSLDFCEDKRLTFCELSSFLVNWIWWSSLYKMTNNGNCQIIYRFQWTCFWLETTHELITKLPAK